ncbi:MAG: HFX_2341 family transcriptional regulator domain-containing protein [Thermoplasmatota archaeon]
MKALQIATVGDDAEAVLVGVREFPVSRLVLVFLPENEKTARDIKGMLAPLRIETDLVVVKGAVVRAVLRVVTTEVRAAHGVYEDIYVNVGGGPTFLCLATLSAAYMNGTRAFAVVDGKAEELPFLRLSYDDVVSESKMQVMRALEKAGGSVDSLQVLSELAGVDKSLLSYHLRGTKDSKGLEELGLVDIERGERGRLIVKLSTMGKVLVSGGGKSP